MFRRQFLGCLAGLAAFLPWKWAPNTRQIDKYPWQALTMPRATVHSATSEINKDGLATVTTTWKGQPQNVRLGFVRQRLEYLGHSRCYRTVDREIALKSPVFGKNGPTKTY